MSYFLDRHVLLTGAASGLGRALALDLARAGADVDLVDLDPAGLEDVAAACRGEGAEVRVWAADVSRPLPAALTGGPTPDLVIANAGLGGNNPGYAFDLALHQRVMAVNFQGAVHTLTPFLPEMCARGRGHLVAISSLAATRGRPLGASYSASKAALAVFLESLRLDLREHGVRVTTVLPGFLATPMTATTVAAKPFQVTAEQAAAEVLEAIRAGKAEHAFPWPLRLYAAAMGWLPAGVFDWVTSRIDDGLKPPEARRGRKAQFFSALEDPWGTREE